MIINFCKMQSLGNDFVMIDTAQTVNKDIFDTNFIRQISDRHYGVGCDLVVLYTIQTDIKMHNKSSSDSQQYIISAHFFNPDGKEVEICGNAIKCLGLLLKKTKNATKCILQTAFINCFLTCTSDDTISFSVEKPCYDNDTIGLSKEIQNPKNMDIHILLEHLFIETLEIYHASAICVGNPHLVLFVKNSPTLEQAQTIGALLESHHLFQNHVNVGFAKILSNSEIDLLVFERGAGLTLACGSGAYAAACIALENKFIQSYSESCTIYQRGGQLQIQFLPDGSALQIGRASFVFSGNMEVDGNCINTSYNSSASFQTSSTTDNLMNVKIYTDGACRGNPGPGGWGGIIISNGKEQEISGYEANTTNNRMELMATINALEQTTAEFPIEIYTDSQYVKNGITIWINNWIRNNWKNADNKPVKNQDLWQRLFHISSQRKISWHWIKGHDGNKFNERADILAKNRIG